ncbi:MAG: hypothetical protein R2825_24410 [Saprospiraceae bacterium]
MPVPTGREFNSRPVGTGIKFRHGLWLYRLKTTYLTNNSFFPSPSFTTSQYSFTLAPAPKSVMFFISIIIAAATPFGAFSKGVTLFISAFYMGRVCKIIYKNYFEE